MSRTQVDHELLDRPENCWQTGDYIERCYHWWTHTYYPEAYKRGVVDTYPHNRLWQRILGPQDTTVVFRHRNWVWHRPEEGWTLYVDRRGPAFHVRFGMSAEEAWEAFTRFREQVDAWFAENPR